MLCSRICSWSKEDPEVRVRQDVKGAWGRGEGCRATPRANQKGLLVCAKGHAGAVMRTGRFSRYLRSTGKG